eukprot:380233_1
MVGGMNYIRSYTMHNNFPKTSIFSSSGQIEFTTTTTTTNMITRSKSQNNGSSKKNKQLKSRLRIRYERENYKEYVLDEPHMTHEGKLYSIYHQRNFQLKYKLDFVILFIYKFMVVGHQRQLLCEILTKEIDGEVVLLEETIILLKDCKIWQWYPATLGIERKLVNIGFVANMNFFRKLQFPKKSYQSNFKLKEIAHHMYFIGTERSKQHPPCKVTIDKLFPQPAAPFLYFEEYEIKVLQYGRKHNGTKIGGGSTCDMLLDSFGSNESIKRWNVTTNDAILNAARKSIMNGNTYFVNEYCADFKDIYLDLDEESSFFGKPNKYEQQKNCSIVGFDGLFSKSLLIGVIMNVCNLKFALKRKPATLETLNEEIIKATPHNLIIFGNDCLEYAAQYGVLNYITHELELNLSPQKAFIEWSIPLDVIDEILNLKVIKINSDKSQYRLQSEVVMIYHRKTSKIMVNKFSWSLQSKESIEENELMNVDE